MNRPSLTCLLLALLTGCEETRSYSLAVRNDLPTPISVCVTKTYGSLEPGWESPEDLAGPQHPASDQDSPGARIDPGKLATRPSFTGRFPRDRGHAVLRVYAGTPTLSEMNAISAGSINRLDVALQEGENRFEIKPDEAGGMTAVRVTGPWPSTQPMYP